MTSLEAPQIFNVYRVAMVSFSEVHDSVDICGAF